MESRQSAETGPGALGPPLELCLSSFAKDNQELRVSVSNDLNANNLQTINCYTPMSDYTYAYHVYVIEL